MASVIVALGFTAPPHWHAPAWWLPQAVCIHQHEGAWNAIGHSGTYDRHGHEYLYYGGMQFLASTWASVGGSGSAAKATPREQLYRAWRVYRRDGSSWREWGTARACGLS